MTKRNAASRVQDVRQTYFFKEAVQHGKITERTRNKQVRQFAEVSIEEGNLYNALQAARQLRDETLIRTIGERCLALNFDWSTAEHAFSLLNDRGKLFEILQKISEVPDGTARKYMGETLIHKLVRNYDRWRAGRKIDRSGPAMVCGVLKMVEYLSGKYDLGIGVIHGGLFPAYVFGLFGLDTRLVSAHRQGDSGGVSFQWVEPSTVNEVEGRRVVVFDKDVVSGRTVRKVLEELQVYRPSRIDLAVMHDPVPKGSVGFGSIIDNVPTGYTAIFYPKKFGYEHFDRTVKRLETLLDTSRG